MECADATAHVTEQLVQEIEVTSEDALKTMNEYRGFYPDLFKPAAQD
jgi:hypothetical protein